MATTSQLTVSQIVALPALTGSCLLTSQALARRRRIASAAVHEMPLTRPIRSGELVMTTGVGLQDDPELFGELLSEAASAQAAGVAVEIGVHVNRVTPAIVDVAERLGLALMTFPWELRFAEVTEIVLRHVVDRQQELLLQMQATRRTLMQIARTGDVHPVLRAAEGLLRNGSARPAEVRISWPGPPTDADDARTSDLPHGSKILTHDIEIGGRRLGTLFVERETPFHSDDHELFGIVSDAVTLALVVSNHVAAEPEPPRDDPLSVLMAPRLRPRNAERLIRALNIDPCRQLRAAYLEFGAPDAARKETYRRLVEQRLRVERVVHLWNDECLALILPESHHEVALVNRLRNSLQEAGAGAAEMVWAGIGRRVDSALDLGLSLREAREACRIGRRLHAHGATVDYGDIGAYTLLREALRNDDMGGLRRLAERLAGPLHEYEQRMAVPLLTTLEVFFDSNRNASVASRSLRVNRQTLLRRLERVATLTGIDLSSADDLFSLEVAVRSRPNGQPSTAAVTG
jgi:purine catabolism regulator